LDKKLNFFLTNLFSHIIGLVGEVFITVLAARNLKAADRGGSSDPYVKVLRNKKLIYKTKHIHKNLNPIWTGERTSYRIGPHDTANTMMVTFFVKDHNVIGSSVDLGDAELDVLSELKKLNAGPTNPVCSFDVWIPIKSGTGDLHIFGEFRYGEGEENGSGNGSGSGNGRLSPGGSSRPVSLLGSTQDIETASSINSHNPKKGLFGLGSKKESK